jgi:pimeloyl-ACP methyl ester carboxylesterase
MPLYEEYEKLGEELERSEGETETESHGWYPDQNNPPDGFPKMPEPSPEPGTNTPELFLKVSKARPLILVPGIMGTALERFDRGSQGPFNVRAIWPPVNLASSDTTRLDNLSAQQLRPQETSNNPLVQGAYDGLIAFLTNELGYELGKTLFIFGYVWTQSNEISGRRLAGFIQLVNAKFNWGNTPQDDRKPDIICHSMGGLVSRAAMRIWGAQVKRTIYLASPHYGAPLAYGALHPDVTRVPFYADFAARMTTNLSSTDSLDSTLLRLASQFESVYELLPDEFYFPMQAKGIVEIDDVGDNTFPTDLDTTYYDNSISRLPNKTKVEEAMQFKKRLGSQLPGERYFVIASKSEITKNFAEMNEAGGIVLNGFMKTEGKTPNGDGTVPAYSGEGPDLRVLVTGKHTVLPNLRETFWWIAFFLAVTG